MNLNETSLGIEISFSQFLVFFGFQDTTLDDLKNAYEHLHFQTMHQVHGKDYQVISETLKDEPVCDALVTQKKSIALVVKSADCLPIMIADERTGKISGIHAGWKGVENRIFPEVLHKEFSDPSNTHVIVGPHITWPSFEVDLNVKNQLLQSLKVKFDELSIVKSSVNNKSLVNLFGIVQLQALENQISTDQFFTFLEDTKTSTRFNSFRRNRESKKRNLSFITIP